MTPSLQRCAPTSICEQVRGYDPASLAVAFQIVDNGHQRGAYDRRFEGREEDAEAHAVGIWA